MAKSQWDRADNQQRQGWRKRLLLGLRKRLFVLGVAFPAIDVLAHFWWLPDLLTHFRVYWCIPVALLFTFECIAPPRGKWRIAIVLGLALYVIFPVGRYYLPVSRDHTRQTSSKEITVALLNVLYSNNDDTAVSDYINETQPEILLMMETGREWSKRLSHLRGPYPYQVQALREHPFGIWFLSKHPIKKQAILPSPEIDTPILDVTVTTPAGDLRCIGIHPTPPIQRYGSDENHKWLRLGAELASDSEVPTVLMGDLNATPFTPRFKKLLHDTHLRDSSLGFGITRTWHSGIPLVGIPIDHVLVSDYLTVLERSVGPNVGSDHRPVFTRLALRGTKEKLSHTKKIIVTIFPWRK